MKVWGATEEDVRAAAKGAQVKIWGDYAYSYEGAEGFHRNGIDRTGKTERSALSFRLSLAQVRAEEGNMPRERNEEGRLKPAKPFPWLWQRRGFSFGRSEEPRRIASVCWHGHYAFMRFLFELRPEARVQSYMADYRGREEFLSEAPETAYRNIGSAYYPLCLCDACFCAEHGREDISELDRAAKDWFAANYPALAEEREEAAEIAAGNTCSEHGNCDNFTLYGECQHRNAEREELLGMIGRGFSDAAKWNYGSRA